MGSKMDENCKTKSFDNILCQQDELSRSVVNWTRSSTVIISELEGGYQSTYSHSIHKVLCEVQNEELFCSSDFSDYPTSITRKAILEKTHYGIKIYSFILSRYFPNEIHFIVTGTQCSLARNPFNNGKKTLSIEFSNSLARHVDTESAIPPGDVFDFAALFFNQKGEQLLETINREMCLHINEKRDFYSSRSDKYPVKERYRSRHFSFFNSPIRNIYPQCSLTLYEVYFMIKGEQYKVNTARLRSIADRSEASKFKTQNFDYCTFSGVFRTRNDKNLCEHSDLMVIDMDHLDELEDTKRILLNDPLLEPQLLFVSPSGDGLKLVVEVNRTKYTHEELYKAVANYLLEIYGIKADSSCCDVSRACFLPHDPNVYINPKYL